MGFCYAALSVVLLALSRRAYRALQLHSGRAKRVRACKTGRAKRVGACKTGQNYLINRSDPFSAPVARHQVVAAGTVATAISIPVSVERKIFVGRLVAALRRRVVFAILSPLNLPSVLRELIGAIRAHHHHGAQ